MFEVTDKLKRKFNAIVEVQSKCFEEGGDIKNPTKVIKVERE